MRDNNRLTISDFHFRLRTTTQAAHSHHVRYHITNKQQLRGKMQIIIILKQQARLLRRSPMPESSTRANQSCACQPYLGKDPPSTYCS